MADPPLMRKIKFIKKTMGLTYNLDPTQRGERERHRDRDRQRLREMGKTEERNERRGREEGEGKERDGLVLTGFYVQEGCVM